MTLIELAHHRLANQQLTATNFKTAKEVVEWMCAMQAQDYAMAKWAIGKRLSNSTEESVELAINNGEIIRTHVMRPTWHFVSAKDVRWMLALTAPHIFSSVRSSQKKMGLDEKLFKKTDSIIEKSLINNNYLTRTELVAELRKNKIVVDPIQAIHVMFNAELNGIICNGPMREKQFTYAILDERIGKTKSLKRDEAMAELAKRYFISHGPATWQDFMWWSGLPAADAKTALESVKSKLVSEVIENKTYWAHYFDPSIRKSEYVHFLPSFDELMISYKDRSATLDAKHTDSAITRNGIFKPIIVVNGKAIGLWKRSLVKDKVVIETTFFRTSEKLNKRTIASVLGSYGSFLNKKIEVK